MAGGQGFEPQFLHPECNVLPLDDPPIYKQYEACIRAVILPLLPAVLNHHTPKPLIVPEPPIR